MNPSRIYQSFKNGHSRSCGNGLNQPLDSGLRRAATGVLGGLFPTPLYHLRPLGVPSRRIQDFLSINDGRGRSRAFAGNGRRAIGIQPGFSPLRRHSGAGPPTGM